MLFRKEPFPGRDAISASPMPDHQPSAECGRTGCGVAPPTAAASVRDTYRVPCGPWSSRGRSGRPERAGPTIGSHGDSHALLPPWELPGTRVPRTSPRNMSCGAWRSRGLNTPVQSRSNVAAGGEVKPGMPGMNARVRRTWSLDVSTRWVRWHGWWWRTPSGVRTLRLRTERTCGSALRRFISRYLWRPAIERDHPPNLAAEWMRSVFDLEDRQQPVLFADGRKQLNQPPHVRAVVVELLLEHPGLVSRVSPHRSSRHRYHLDGHAHPLAGLPRRYRLASAGAGISASTVWVALASTLGRIDQMGTVSG